MDAAERFAKRKSYNNAGDYFVKETRFIFWDSGQSDSTEATRNQADFGGSATTIGSNLIKCNDEEALRVTVEEVTLPYIWKAPYIPPPPDTSQQWWVHFQFLMPMSQAQYAAQPDNVYYPELMQWYRTLGESTTPTPWPYNLRTEADGNVCVVPGDRGIGHGDKWLDADATYHIVDVPVDMYGHCDSYQAVVNHIVKVVEEAPPNDNYVALDPATAAFGVPTPFYKSFPSSVAGLMTPSGAYVNYFAGKLPACIIDPDNGFRFAAVDRTYKLATTNADHPLNHSSPMNVPFRMVCYSAARAKELGREGSGEAVFAKLHMSALDTYHVSDTHDYDAASKIPSAIDHTTGRRRVVPSFRGKYNDPPSTPQNNDWRFRWLIEEGQPANASPTFITQMNENGAVADYDLQLLVMDTTFGGMYATPQPPNAMRDDYVLLEMDGCARNIAAYPSFGEPLTATQRYPYEEESVIAKVDLPKEKAGQTVVWRNWQNSFATRYASNHLNKLQFRLLDADWFKRVADGLTPAIQFVSSSLAWSLVLRVETLARKHTGLGLMAESLFLQHIQVMQGDILMRNAAKHRGDRPGVGGDGAKPTEPPKTPEDQFHEVMAEFNQKYKSSLYPGGPGWSVNRLEQALAAPNEKPALHADKTGGA